MNRLPGMALVVLSSLSISVGLKAQRPGGEVRKRTDDQKRVYFEVFADHINGNHGEPAPMRTGGPATWPRRVEIRGESFWMIDKSPGGRVDAGGGAGTARRLVAPEFPRGALIARWVSLDAETPPRVIPDTLPTKPLSGWLLIGNKATLDLPIPTKVVPRPFRASWQSMIPGIGGAEEFRYTPLVLLQYLCNDDVDGFGDNDGWLHVYQTWIW
jgi:hypothetical protein